MVSMEICICGDIMGATGPAVVGLIISYCVGWVGWMVGCFVLCDSNKSR
jgi:hypothetical protein